MATVSLNAEKREGKGSGPAGRLRRNGWVPGVLYGLSQDNVLLQVQESEIGELMRSGHIQGLIHLAVEKKTVPAMLKDYQMHPVTRQLLSVDFLRVDPKAKIRTRIPLRLTGEPEDLPEGATVEQVLHEIEIEALPGEIPDEVVVDVRDLRHGEPLTVGDLQPSGEWSYVTPGEEPVAIITAAARVAVEEIAEEAEAAEEAAPAEGPTPEESKGE